MRDTKFMRRYRKITPFEWVYLSATAAFPPFAIQLRIDLSVLPAPELLERALEIAASANPGARLVAAGQWWLDSGKSPSIRIVSAEEIFSLSHPHLHAALSCDDKPPIEVLYWHEAGLIFRCAHALMDAAGLLFFAQETFRALRGEGLRGTTSNVSDYEYLRGLKHPQSRPLHRADKKSPLGAPVIGKIGFVWEQRFIPGRVASVGARLAAAIARMTKECVGRIMMPVDLRRTDSTLRSTANLSSPLFLDLRSGSQWADCHRKVLAALGRHDERATSHLDAIVPWVPKAVLHGCFQYLHERQVRTNQYLFSATTSDVGTIALTDFSTQECVPNAIAFLPFNVPGSAISLLSVQHDKGLEIAASCPMATGDAGQLGRALDQLCAELEKDSQPIQRPSTQNQQQQQVVIASSFVSEPIENVLAFWMKKFNLPSCIQFAPYNQIFQSLMDPQSGFSRNTNGVNLILLRLEDWTRYADESSAEHDYTHLLRRNGEDLIAAVDSASRKMNVPLLIWIAPLSQVTQNQSRLRATFEETQQYLCAQLGSMPGVQLICAADLHRFYPAGKVEDEMADKQGHIPYTQEMFAAMATLLARKIIALRSRPYKVIVLDCDNTLWQGVCGEVGPQGIAVAPAYKALQEFMREQYDAGMLLCLCSKNNPDDVDAVFEQCADMRLNKSHFIASRINWNFKSENIQSLAEELQLGLDSFIFIDDSPVECAEVQASCETVLVLQLPEEAERIPVFLQHIWAFDRQAITQDAQQRTLQYQQNQHRETLRASANSFESFLDSLALQVDVSPLQTHQLERVAELTRRTNQFNLRPHPRQTAEIRALVDTNQCLVVEVQDRFGSYGLTGVVVYSRDDDLLKVDTFLLSCRVLGRGVEHRVLAQLGKIAEQAGCQTILLSWLETGKNQPAMNFLESSGAVRNDGEDPGKPHTFTLPVEQAMCLTPAQSTADATSKETPLSREWADSGTTGNFVLLKQIAHELNDVSQILQAARHAPTAAFSDSLVQDADCVLPIGMEAILSGIFIELSGSASTFVPPDKSLIDLGMDSLQMVMLLSLSARRFAPEIAHDLLFADLDEFIREPTLKNLAKHFQKLSSEPEGALIE